MFPYSGLHGQEQGSISEALNPGGSSLMQLFLWCVTNRCAAAVAAAAAVVKNQTIAAVAAVVLHDPHPPVGGRKRQMHFSLSEHLACAVQCCSTINNLKLLRRHRLPCQPVSVEAPY
jgi:hypothetical protein